MDGCQKIYMLAHELNASNKHITIPYEDDNGSMTELVVPVEEVSTMGINMASDAALLVRKTSNKTIVSKAKPLPIKTIPEEVLEVGQHGFAVGYPDGIAGEVMLTYLGKGAQGNYSVMGIRSIIWLCGR